MQIDLIHTTVEHIIYEGNNDFKILRLRDDDDAAFSAKGTFPDVGDGARIAVAGDWIEYKGRPTLACTYYEPILPTTASGMKEYLASGCVQGCGPTLAERIVREFGADTFAVLDTDPDRLLEVHGIGEKKKARIKDGWKKQKSLQTIGQFLFLNGISLQYANRIRKELGDNAVDIIKQNPYRLCEIHGIGFATADKVALKNGIDRESPFRIVAGISHILEEERADGHTFVYEKVLLSKTGALLKIKPHLATNGLMLLLETGNAVQDGDAVYAKSLYRAEVNTAKKLKILQDSAKRECEAVPADELEEIFGITYGEQQKEAIALSAEEGVLVITGGPGTGKSTILAAILEQYKRAGLTVKMAAPTGRAAKRMSETTGKEAFTIHRMLMTLENNDKGADEMIDADAVIIDEASMVDISLMNWLLSYMKDETRLILIGDVDQLPPVGPGNVLKDIIGSGTVPTVKLQRIFRQGKESLITEDAFRVNSGDTNLLFNQKGGDVYFLKKSGAEQMSEAVVSLMAKQIPEKFGYSPDDIQVLSPMKKREAGTRKLNEMLQAALNPLKQKEDEVCGFRIGDRVMNLRNNYKKDVYNGDTGTLISIDREDKTAEIMFDDRIVEFDFDELDDISLCYATTVHKAQGSEYPVVVMPVTKDHRFMLKRQLFYTAITRAKKLLVLVVEPEALFHAVVDTEADKRNTRLRERLKEGAGS